MEDFNPFYLLRSKKKSDIQLLQMKKMNYFKNMYQ